MNRCILAFLVFFLPLFSDVFAQENTDHFMRDYVAPDFKLRRFSLSASGNGTGTVTDNLNTHKFELTGNLSYYQISNQRNYQGTISATLNEGVGFSLDDSNSILGHVLLMQNITTNRFYFNERWFIGVHDDSRFAQSAIRYSADTISDFSLTGFLLRPAVSIGYGRVEWVQFARQAMDIERSLASCNHLSPAFSESNRTNMADRIAKISNRRYYDFRFGIIEQLQSLDSLLTSNDMITNSDIVYYSHLQDAFLYSRQTTRLSGFRHELGVTQGIEFGSQSANVGLTSYGFYNFNYFLPQSYAIQHDLQVSVIGGSRGNTFNAATTFPIWTDLKYTFGLYPTTRTYIGVSAVGGINIENNIGYLYGANIDAYYWISPKLRFSVQGKIYDGVDYQSHDFSHVAISNPDRNLKMFDYSLKLNLSYAIF